MQRRCAVPGLVHRVERDVQYGFVKGRLDRAGGTCRRRAFQIAVREVEGGRIYDVKRLTRQGSDTWRSSYLGLGLSLERAQGIAQPNYLQLKTRTNYEQPVKAHLTRRTRARW